MNLNAVQNWLRISKFFLMWIVSKNMKMGLQNLLFICCYTKNEKKVNLKGTLSFNISLHASWYANPTMPLKIIILSKRHLLFQQTNMLKSLLLHRLSDLHISSVFLSFVFLLKSILLPPHLALSTFNPFFVHRYLRSRVMSTWKTNLLDH